MTKHDGLANKILETEYQSHLKRHIDFFAFKQVDHTIRAKQPVKDWYRYQEAAARISDILGYEISVKTLRRLVNDGQLPSKKIGNRVFISEQFISKYLQEPDKCQEAKALPSNYTALTNSMARSSGQVSSPTNGTQSGMKTDASISAAQALNMSQELLATNK